MQTSTESVDALIVGGGPAAMAAALTLRDRGLSVLAVDRPRAAHNPGETLGAETLALLERLGARERFLALDPPRIHLNRSAWGTSETAERLAINNPHGGSFLVDRARFDAVLRGVAAERGVLVDAGTVDRAPARDSDGSWTVPIRTSEGHSVIRARMLLDATGRAASVARRLGAHRLELDALVAIHRRFRRAGAPGEVEWVTLTESVECGWWYASALPDGGAVATFFTDADLARPLGAGSEEGWSGLLARTTLVSAWLLQAGYRAIDVPFTVPARTGRTVPLGGSGQLCVGDAAMTLDPLSSRGLSASMVSGIHAATALAAEASGDRDAISRYVAQLEAVHLRHRQLQAAYYRLERRWLSSRFWVRRAGTPIESERTVPSPEGSM